MILYVIVDFFILLVCRLATITVMTGLLMLFKGGKLKGLSVKEVILVAFAGMIRGSIAYALVVKLANHGATTPEQKTNAR